MQAALPTSPRFSLLRPVRFNSLHRKKSSRDKNCCISPKSDSKQTLPTDSETGKEAAKQDTLSADDDLAAPELDQRVLQDEKFITTTTAASDHEPSPETRPGLKLLSSRHDPSARPDSQTEPPLDNSVECDADGRSSSELCELDGDTMTPNSNNDSDKELAPAEGKEAVRGPRKSEETMKEVRKSIGSTRRHKQTAGTPPDKLFRTSIILTKTPVEDSAGSTPEAEEMPFSPGRSDDGLYEMDVPIHLVRDSRPDLQLAARLHVMAGATQPLPPGRKPTLPTDAPPASPAMLDVSRTMGETQPAHISIASTERMESPKPKRPFSAQSIEGVITNASTKAAVLPALKSAHSMSSTDTSEQDGKSSEHSPRSSMSSVNSAAEAKQVVEPEVPPKEAPVRGHARLGSTSLYHSALMMHPNKSSSNLHEPPKYPLLRRQASVDSLTSNLTTANINKPLPPEPKRMSTISSQGSENSSLSRSSSSTIRPPTFRAQPHDRTRSDDLPQIQSSRRTSVKAPARSSISALSLRSKYAPKDVDALDEEISRSIARTRKNSQNPSPPPQRPSEHPYLSIIKEDANSRPDSKNPTPKPKKRSPPPGSSSKLAHTSRPRNGSEPILRREDESNWKLKRRPTDGFVEERVRELQQQQQQQQQQQSQKPSRGLVRGSSKAERILGKSPEEKDPVFQINTSLGRSMVSKNGNSPNSAVSKPLPSKDSPNGNGPSPISATTTVSQFSPSDSLFSPKTGREDASVQEIRKRLELLSPKDDPNTTFQTFRQRLTSPSSREQLQPSAYDIDSPTIVDSGLIVVELEAPNGVSKTPKSRRSQIVELEGDLLPALFELPLPSPKLGETFRVPDLEESANKKEKKPRPVTMQSVLSAKSQSSKSQRSGRARSLASLAASEIPELYAQISHHSGRTSSERALTAEEEEAIMTAEAAERVLLYILQSFSNFADLFSAARVSRGFYRTFKRHELPLLKQTLYRVSPAAWELREMSHAQAASPGLDPGAKEYTARVYFSSYVKDLITIVKLKALILENCKTFLRQDTIAGLSGETARSAAIDDAFWRVWTFCRIFGCGHGFEDDLAAQMDWLKGGPLARKIIGGEKIEGLAPESILQVPPYGFAEGNGPAGLSETQLFDMTEIWTCLGVLVQGYLGKRDEARAHGVFENAQIKNGDIARENAVLEEWTYYIMTQAPTIVLDVASPSAPSQETFEYVRSQGYTEWVPPPEGYTRSTFLKEAVRSVYDQNREVKRPLPSDLLLSHSNLSPASSLTSPSPGLSPQQRVVAHAAQLQAIREDPFADEDGELPNSPFDQEEFRRVLGKYDSRNKSTSSLSKIPSPSLSSRFPRWAQRSNSVTEPHSSQALRQQMESPTEYGESIDRIASASPRGQIGLGSRLAASLRGKFTGRFSPTNTHSARLRPLKISSPLAVSHESLASALNAPPSFNPSRDPMERGLERLVRMGYSESAARKALRRADNGSDYDFEKAVCILKAKDEAKKQRLERLDRMG